MRWWQRLLQRRRVEDQLKKELSFHLQQHEAELIARGCDPGEARRRARLEFGNPDGVMEDCRDARGTRWLEDLAQDVRYAVRTLRQAPSFAAVALLTLALGVGASTVMFTVINGVLLRPLPYAEPDRLVSVQGQSANFGNFYLSYPDFLDCRRDNRSLQSLVGWVFQLGATLSEPGTPEFVDLRDISSGLFATLGVPLLKGREFLPEEDRAGAPPVVIISYGLWQRRLGGAERALGHSLVLDGKRYTIVGIAPPGFRLEGDDAGVFTPLGQNTARYLQIRRAHPVRVVGRLRPGVTPAAAHGEFALIGNRFAKQYPDTDGDGVIDLQQLRPEVGDVGATLWLLLGAVSLVLLIACANVASLLLARAISRERELAMRAALGAGRLRLVRQCLTESAVLGLGGGALGVVFAIVGIRPFVLFWPGSLPRAEEVQLDWRVLLFAVVVSLLCGLLFGLAPALRVPVRHLETTLRAGGRTGTHGSSRRLHGSFVVSEIALAVVLLVCAGMLGRTLLQLSSLDPGVNIHNVLTARMALPSSVLENPARTRAAWQDLMDRARRLPGVESIAAVDTVPMRPGNNQLGYWTNAAIPPDNKQPVTLATTVTPDYLKVMGIPLREGRFFNDDDRLGHKPVIVIDDVLARHAYGEASAVGRQLWVPGMGTDPFEVIGVVGHVRHWGLANDDRARVRDQLYYPFAQVPDSLLRRWSELMSIAVRTSVPPSTVLGALRREASAAARDQVLYEVNTMEQLAARTLARQRFLMVLFGVFAGMALLLACVGIYGVLAYVTGQRVPEIGVRMALGARPGDVVRLVLRQSLGMIGAGVVVGVAGSLAAVRLMGRLVAGMASTEPLTVIGMILVLVVAALAASYLPARRASRIAPVSALRLE
jgi:predicted permease